MRAWWMLLLANTACGEPLQDGPPLLHTTAEAPQTDAAEDTESAEIDTGSPAHVSADLQEVAQEVVEVRNDLDTLRCYLLHEKELREGRVPLGWKQPPMEEYEKHPAHPCKMLPGFVDPKKEEREALPAQQQEMVPASIDDGLRSQPLRRE